MDRSHPWLPAGCASLATTKRAKRAQALAPSRYKLDDLIITLLVPPLPRPSAYPASRYLVLQRDFADEDSSVNLTQD